ncbi:MAG: autotransporter-associated beta strand repeat-containing protein [Phycisphaerae bacterium]|nr:autotransporter-associated beta strand repeat-containing protein [Phycisphaerae bacterium]
MNKAIGLSILSACLIVLTPGFVLCGIKGDQTGILKKAIPDKLVVLTFDDSCASHATVVAPILKRLGFGATFYICNFDSFSTRKDWYLTWSQMKAMAGDGFEIGNHTSGHGGRPRIAAFLNMEDQLLANNVVKPTTVCWPMYQVNTKTYPDLVANGYIFGRGGYFRPYRPTVDNPFDVPSFGVQGNVSIEKFISYVQQAAGGRIVVLTFHGVPDMEHPQVSLAPDIFKEMMQYLKNNNYKAVAMRDLEEYIDPAKAAKLPPTVRNLRKPIAGIVVNDDKSYLTKEIRTFRFPGLAPARLFDSTITVKVPHATDITALAPTYTLTDSVTCVPASGRTGDFSRPRKYTVKAPDGSTRVYTVIVKRLPRPAAAEIRSDKTYKDDKITTPIELASDLSICVLPRGRATLDGLISGRGSLVKNGPGTLTVSNKINTYSGGTVINGGRLYLFLANKGLGTGPVTVNEGGNLVLERGDITGNRLVMNGGCIDANNGFGGSWNGDIILKRDAGMAAYAAFHLNKIRGGISGSGGLTQIGARGAFSRVNRGRVVLWGVNTYKGPTTVLRGMLAIKKAASLYNANVAKWTAKNIRVSPAASFQIAVGGTGEFTGGQVGALLTNLTARVDNNGLAAGSVFCMDTSNAGSTVTVSSTITDSKGPGGGAFVLKKCGPGVLQLTGSNTYTGRTVLEGGALSVASLNSVTGGRPCSSLGAPTTIENGEIFIRDNRCALIYTGEGETTDRVLNLAGKKAAFTLDHSGRGLLKFTGDLVISGYGHDKTIVLAGSTTGAGQLACDIKNPYDRAGVAKTSVTKTGTGTWALSGANTYTGATIVKEGVLSLANPRALGVKTDVHISNGAVLDLSFAGLARVGKLYLNGKLQPRGTYSAKNAPKYIKGIGVCSTQEHSGRRESR